MKDAALLIVDVQKFCFSQITPVFQENQLIDNLNLLVGQARLNQFPIVWIQHTDAALLAEGSDGWQLHPKLFPSPEDIRIQKGEASALRGTPLELELKKRSIRKVVVAGVASQWCVKATCIDAKKTGFEVILVEDAHSNFQPNAKKVIRYVNSRLSKEGIAVLPVADVMAMLQ